MRKLLIIVSFVIALLAVVLAVTPLSNLAYLPAIIALVLGLVLYYISKKQNNVPKTVQYVLLLAVISIGISSYKLMFNKSEVGDTEALEVRANESVKDSKELLNDIDVDVIDAEETEGFESVNNTTIEEVEEEGGFE